MPVEANATSEHADWRRLPDSIIRQGAVAIISGLRAPAFSSAKLSKLARCQ
jgi:hypothetical protein